MATCYVSDGRMRAGFICDLVPDQSLNACACALSVHFWKVHITHVKHFGPGTAVGKAHLLDDIIDNIELFGSDFYQRKTLQLVVGEHEEQWQVYKPCV